MACLLVLALALLPASHAVVLDPSPFTAWGARSTDGLSRRADVDVPFTNSTGSDDRVYFWRGDFVGDAQQRGFAQGELFADEIVRLYRVDMPRYFAGAGGLDLSKLPPGLAAAITAGLAETAFYRAMQWVWDQESSFVPTRLVAEMDAVAQGLCAARPVVGSRACDVSEWTDAIRQLNMFPELIKMTCTMFGAWGSASASGSLLQLRALDLGASPLSNYTLLAVHRPAPAPSQSPRAAQHANAVAGAPDSGPRPWPSPGGRGSVTGSDAGDLWQAFASLSFPGLVGVITGVSEKGIGLSEKVWEVSGEPVQEGHFDGEADVMVMRDVLELAPNRSVAEAYMAADAQRTFAVWLGVGDYATQQLDICGYREADFNAYTPDTMPAMTTQPFMKDLVYVDKHTQPSDSTDLPTLLADRWGKLDIATTIEVVSAHETGDCHIAVYDFAPSKPTMWFALGRINDAMDFGADGREWKACFRPFVEYELAALWKGAPP